ncbi:MAG: hypothetical protein ABI691_16655 [Ginsengibacter sp.]
MNRNILLATPASVVMLEFQNSSGHVAEEKPKRYYTNKKHKYE